MQIIQKPMLTKEYLAYLGYIAERNSWTDFDGTIPSGYVHIKYNTENGYRDIVEETDLGRAETFVWDNDVISWKYMTAEEVINHRAEMSKHRRDCCRRFIADFRNLEHLPAGTPEKIYAYDYICKFFKMRNAA